ncbi:DUF427 domain-containing protein [Phytohabitans flavus]|uniref:DUF427 domain-containing protein n=2 Tax=Phytohabitans flavus TaxID=1076124 RepID=A0A6F8XV27_9ACTN|nr:hypothetical protein Pflav_040010 [Phytohabitans flavus]
MGSGPFGHAPAGAFVPGMVLIEPYPRRMRGLLDGETIVDSSHGQLVHEPGRLPRCFFPMADVRTDLLVPGPAGVPSAALGESQVWDLRVGDRLVERAAIAYPAPPPEATRVKDHIALYWRALDQWYEEDVLAVAHIRDPYHRVDALPSSRHVRVSLDGVTLAESDKPVVIYETSLVPRWYFAQSDVRVPLEPSDYRSWCAYKGEAGYWSLMVGDTPHVNLAWTYHDPRHDASLAKDRVAFFNERVDVDIDGVREERPGGPWADPDWWRDTTSENDL